MHFTLPLVALAASALAAPNSIAKRQAYTSDTENQLMDGTPCRNITVLFARGTFESGNVGETTGPPFFQAIQNMVGVKGVAVQGVDYPADVAGFQAGGDPQGSATLASLIRQTMSQCPNTKLDVSGYSQGGQLVHNAAAMLTPAETNFINSVVIFGDPDNGKPVGSVPASKVLIICHTGDNICQGGSLILPPHLNYAMDAPRAAAFVVQRSKSGN